MKVTNIKLDPLGHNIAIFMCRVHIEGREYPIQFMTGEDDYDLQRKQQLINGAKEVALKKHKELND